MLGINGQRQCIMCFNVSICVVNLHFCIHIYRDPHLHDVGQN